MTTEVHLFGRFAISVSGNHILRLEGSKIQELLAYLLVYRNHQHTRESLATLLWGECTTAQARKYLRQTLWYIQSAFEEPTLPPLGLTLQVEPEWVQIVLTTGAEVDVASFEYRHGLTQGSLGREFSDAQLLAAQEAVGLYGGPLLEGCFQDWCLYERERLESTYLELLDKLMDYCELHCRYEQGIAYGTAVLRLDRARERTHRRLMRLYYRLGDRTAALRQFQRCAAALTEELDVEPASRTLELYRQIRDDIPFALDGTAERPGAPASLDLSQLLPRLHQIRTVIASAEQAVRAEIGVVESAVFSLGPLQKIQARRDASTDAYETL